MKKNIAIAILIVLCFMMMIYARFQQTQAVTEQKLALAIFETAEQKISGIKALAEQKSLHADSLRHIAEVALLECGKKRK